MPETTALKHFRPLPLWFDPDPALKQLATHQALWGANPERLTLPNSPHAQTQDIWLRARPRRELTSKASYGEPHFPAFYPAWHTLSALQPMVMSVMTQMRAGMLGFTMLSRIPAGCAVLPHVDTGWHAEFCHCKAYVILAANERCVNICGDERIWMRSGSSWLFENRVPHSVVNDGDTDRIALIITMRTI